jgi:Spy/CpxP family protein refolding chaperone
MRGGGMAAFRGIEFTDAQKEQLRQIHESNKPSDAEIAEMKAMHDARKDGGELTAEQRDKMKAFRDQRRTKEEVATAQVLAILTPEQRQQYDANKAEMQKRREEFRQQREQRKAAQDTAKPTDNN